MTDATNPIDASGDRLAVYADYVYPFCRLGNATLREYLAGWAERGLPDLAIEWRPFDLRADERDGDGTIPQGAGAGKEGYARSRWSEVASQAGEYGVEMTMDVERYLAIDARNVQLVALGVKRDDPDWFHAFHDSVFDALWTETRDVGDPTVLRKLAASASVDLDSVEAWIADGELQKRFDAATEQATEKGVRGVPTVEYDGELAYGSQPPTAYRELIEGAG